MEVRVNFVLFTFNRYFTLQSGTDGIVCTANINTFLWYIAKHEIALLVFRFMLKLPIDISLILRLKVPLILIVFWIAIGGTNQCIFTIFLFTRDCAIWGVCYELIKKRRKFMVEFIHQSRKTLKLII